MNREKEGMSVYKIAYGLERGGQRFIEIRGTLVCDGIFGIRRGDYAWRIDHIGTGRVVGYYVTKDAAMNCAEALAQVRLPWRCKTVKEWRAVCKAHPILAKRCVKIIAEHGWR